MKPTSQKLWTRSEGKSGISKGPQSTIVISAMGLNDNLVFMGKELHVQTENAGSLAPCILTQVFLNGRVVFSTKSEYTPDFHESHDHSKIQSLMHTQHSQVIQKITDKQTRILKQT